MGVVSRPRILLTCTVGVTGQVNCYQQISPNIPIPASPFSEVGAYFSGWETIQVRTIEFITKHWHNFRNVIFKVLTRPYASLRVCLFWICKCICTSYRVNSQRRTYGELPCHRDHSSPSLDSLHFPYYPPPPPPLYLVVHPALGLYPPLSCTCRYPTGQVSGLSLPYVFPSYIY